MLFCTIDVSYFVKCQEFNDLKTTSEFLKKKNVNSLYSVLIVSISTEYP